MPSYVVANLWGEYAISERLAGNPLRAATFLLTEAHYRGNVFSMPLAESKVTAQGQISVPAEVRRRLGIGPGSVLEWEEQGGQIVVRRAGRYTSTDVHEALFLKCKPKPKPLGELKDGIRRYVRKRHARR